MQEFYVLVAENFTPAFDFDPLPTEIFDPGSDSSVAITGATNASPIRITVASTQANWYTGRKVLVSGVGGNTAANGWQYIQRISGTQFDLIGTTGNGAYTSGGTCLPVNDAQGLPIEGGMAILEHDMLALNDGVIPINPASQNAMHVY